MYDVVSLVFRVVILFQLGPGYSAGLLIYRWIKLITELSKILEKIFQ